MRPILLCTFSHPNDIPIVSGYIQTAYHVTGKHIFVFRDDGNPSIVYYTYNVASYDSLIEQTIVVHRKSETNTIYTINALNEVLSRVSNGGSGADRELDWELYRNSFISIINGEYRKISLELFKIIPIHSL